MAEDAVKSARRVFEILEFFEHHRRPLALKEILDGLGYPASSGSALLKSLVTLGYLDYDRERRSYFPTMRIAALGGWVHDSLFGETQVSQLMNHLYEVTGETVILAAQSDLRAQYVHLIRSAEPLSVAVPPGVRRPLGKSGLGWLLLSAKSDVEIEKLRRRINAEDGEDKLSRDELMATINDVRLKGYAFSKHTFSEGVGVIGALLPTAPQGRTYAIGVAGPVERLERKEALILAELRSGVGRMAA